MVVRRRRAAKFDAEIAEAAREAANATAPVFLDDDDGGDPTGTTLSGHGHGGYGSPDGYVPTHYSDASSHGTYNQPPLNAAAGNGGESYGMRELGAIDAYNPYSAYGATGAAAAAAGTGLTRGRSTIDAGTLAHGMFDGTSPYPAFAAPGAYQAQPNSYTAQNVSNPGPNPYDYGNQGMNSNPAGYNRGPGSPEYDILAAAGMAGAGSEMNRGMSLNHSPNSSTNRASYQSQPIGQKGDQPEYMGYAYSSEQPEGQEEYGDDAYGGYVNEHTRQHVLGKIDERGSLYEDVEQPRLLKVANE